MDLHWMGRYRKLVMALVQHSNITMRTVRIKDKITDDIWLSATEWQVFEYIIEHSEDDIYLNRMSDILALPQSSFSKTVSLLCSYGLVEKYQTETNKKNILVRPTEKGIELYNNKNSRLDAEVFDDFFRSLDDIDDETLNKFADAMLDFNIVLKADSEKRLETFKKHVK